jgi:hypothetical protein
MASEAARCEAGSLLLTNRTASGRSVTLDEKHQLSTAEPDHHPHGTVGAGAGRSNARWIRLCRHKSSSASRCADLSFRPKVSPEPRSARRSGSLLPLFRRLQTLCEHPSRS